MLSLMLVSLVAFPLFAQDAATGWIEGQMMTRDGMPMSNGTVVFFSADSGPAPDINRYVRIPDQVADLDREGKFLVSLPAGRYYMGAIKRISDAQMGPPRDGDYIYNNRDDQGVLVAYIIEKNKGLNVGAIAKAEPFKKTFADDLSGIAGTVRDQYGNPIKDAIIYAYVTRAMTGLPAFISYGTGKDGEFIITMDKGGEYYLRVNDPYTGGPPLTGNAVGAFGGNDPVAVTVKTGEIAEGMLITIVRSFERVPDTRQIE